MSVPVKLGVLGSPLEFTLSPVLHRAGMSAIGIEAESMPLRTGAEELPERLARLAADGYRGVNLTMPLKEAVIPHLARVSPDARRARSVNTVGFGPDGWWGETTDGPGFVDLLESLGRDPAQERVLLLGAGGAARSLALALLGAGCGEITVGTRQVKRAAESWSGIPGVSVVAAHGRGAEEERDVRATMVVKCTQRDLGWQFDHPWRAGLLVVDLAYDEDLPEWVPMARARGAVAFDGLGLLVFQARRSLSLWAGREVPLEPLARAVGWPR